MAADGAAAEITLYDNTDQVAATWNANRWSVVVVAGTDLDNSLAVASRQSGWIMAYVGLRVRNVETVTQAAREIFGNIPDGTPEPTAWPLQNPVVYTLICVAANLIVFVPLSIRRYDK